MSPKKSEEKTFVKNVSRKKKFVVEIDEKYVDKKKHQMVTYIIGKAYDKKILRHNIKKKLSDVDRQKKNLFSIGGKKKSLQATKTLGCESANLTPQCMTGDDHNSNSVSENRNLLTIHTL